MANKKWYTIEIMYKSDTETRLYRLINLDSGALKVLRQNMFIEGVYRKIDEDTGEILSPWQIKKVTVCRQAHFFAVTPDQIKGLEKSNGINSPKK